MATLIGMWIIPLGISLRNAWWRFVVIWCAFTMITSAVMIRALEKPIRGSTPRWSTLTVRTKRKWKFKKSCFCWVFQVGLQVVPVGLQGQLRSWHFLLHRSVVAHVRAPSPVGTQRRLARDLAVPWLDLDVLCAILRSFGQRHCWNLRRKDGLSDRGELNEYKKLSRLLSHNEFGSYPSLYGLNYIFLPVV